MWSLKKRKNTESEHCDMDLLWAVCTCKLWKFLPLSPNTEHWMNSQLRPYMSEFQTEEHNHCIYSLHHVDHNNLVVSASMSAGTPARKGYTNLIAPKYPLMGDRLMSYHFYYLVTTAKWILHTTNIAGNICITWGRTMGMEKRPIEGTVNFW